MNFTLAGNLPYPFQAAEKITLQHNLPVGSGFFVIQVMDGLRLVAASISFSSSMVFAASVFEPGRAYKLLAFQVDSGVQDGVWWVDQFIHTTGTVNVEFKSQGAASGGGDPQSFTGQTLINGQPVQRQVLAVGIDGDAPRFLAQAQSNQQGQYTLNWQGYTGQVLVTALDDYGSPWVAGAVLGVGERIRPTVPNGYVYQVSSSGTLAMDEPQWPEQDGEAVVSGSVVMVARAYYRPKTAGPVVVV